MKEDLKELKIQKLPWGSLALDPLEACAFGARLGNQSVFILDPRLLLLLLIASTLFVTLHLRNGTPFLIMSDLSLLYLVLEDS